MENQNIIDIKWVTIEHPKSSCKSSKTIRQAKKISHASGSGKNSSLFYDETTKTKNL